MTAGMKGYMAAGMKVYMAAGTKGYMTAGMKGYMTAGTKGYMTAGMKGYMTAGTKGYMTAGMKGYMTAGMKGYMTSVINSQTSQARLCSPKRMKIDSQNQPIKYTISHFTIFVRHERYFTLNGIHFRTSEFSFIVYDQILTHSQLGHLCNSVPFFCLT